MKNYLLIFLQLFSMCLMAQTDQINQDKYWGYRDRLVRNFMKVGKEAGHSLPMAYPVLLSTAKDPLEESHTSTYMLFTFE
jgi:hypothetical protein